MKVPTTTPLSVFFADNYGSPPILAARMRPQSVVLMSQRTTGQTRPIAQVYETPDGGKVTLNTYDRAVTHPIRDGEELNVRFLQGRVSAVVKEVS